ncbi:YqjD family protein [Methylotenera sp.]|uniref:DUF883 family protein n=1 Tax=Methylotenera sp. TaxID=2051956 RepID=UPI00248A2ED1|nr:DUF883 family protein [Methylotenera sp.]MDI1361787.1 DUF883 family protein [Methylotenera sp.]
MEKLLDKQSEERLVEDFKEVIADAEALLKVTANTGGEKIAEARSKVEGSIQAAKAAIGESKTAILTKAKAIKEDTDAYVHENPWKSIGFAASVGVIVGLLICRRH